MRKLVIIIVVVFCFLSVPGCKTWQQDKKISYTDYRITTSLRSNTGIDSLIKPYSDSVNRSMNDVVGIVGSTLEKKQPESSLGNLMADAILQMARQKFAAKVDVSFVNYGGVRLNEIPAGKLTRGKVFELMPFDNTIVLQTLNGEVLQQYLDFIASKGGWPCAGITMEIKNKKAVNAMINGKIINKNSSYVVVQSDFIANGGDDAFMLKSIPQQNIGYLLRDALFDYIYLVTNGGKKITAATENRVINVE